VLLSTLSGPVVATAGESRATIAGCPGYVDHLRTARAYLERKDRGNAVAELKKARESLRECEATQASETALACVAVGQGAGA
jgi:hypothetical protein